MLRQHLQAAEDKLGELRSFARVQIDVHHEVLQHRATSDGALEIVDQHNEHQTHTWFMANGVNQIKTAPWTPEEDRALVAAVRYDQGMGICPTLRC